MDDKWDELYKRAKEVLNPRTISSSVEAGSVAAAILSKDGNIYVGVCIDMACSIGMCAERNALSTMITMNENKIDKLICIGRDDKIMLPCGVCREFMMQLDSSNKDTEIMVNYETRETVKLSQLLPRWWN